MSLTQRQVALHKCEQIEYQNRRKPTVIKNKFKKASQKWQSCQCMVCGEYLDMLTTPHAERHGYKTTAEIIKAGYIRFIGGN